MEIYLVGGAVRDALLNKPVHERDYVVVGSTAEHMLRLGFRQVGKDFPVFLHPQTGEEYALARIERKTAKGYTGFTVHAAPDVTLEQDLQRRDLTINAIAQSQNGQLIDPYGGLEDIRLRQLRHVSDAFTEDPLRILRVARFAARFAADGFTVAPETLALMRQMSAAGELAELAPERVWRETEKALQTSHSQMFWRIIDSTQSWSPWYTELATKLDIALLEQQLERLPLQCKLQQFSVPELAQMRWALSCSALSATEYQQLATRLKLPNAYTNLVNSVFRVSYDEATQMTPQWFFEAIGKADGWRRPDALRQLIAIWQAQGLVRDTAQQLQALYQQALQVNAQQVLAQAALQQQQLVGAAIGEAIREQQLAVITANWKLSN